jgi:hypothetical protein
VKQYGVSSVEQLVKLFEVRARIADIAAANTGILPPRDYEVEAAVWRDAVELLNSIEFFGWEQHNG